MSTITTASSTREHRVTVRSLAGCKRRGERFTMLTAYDFTFASIFETAGIDVILVGDSLGNVIQGCDTTLPVTLDEAIYHTRLVARAVARSREITLAAPWPGRSGTSTRRSRDIARTVRNQLSLSAPKPWTSTTGSPSPHSRKGMRSPPTVTDRSVTRR